VGKIYKEGKWLLYVTLYNCESAYRLSLIACQAKKSVFVVDSYG